MAEQVVREQLRLGEFNSEASALAYNRVSPSVLGSRAPYVERPTQGHWQALLERLQQPPRCDDRLVPTPYERACAVGTRAMQLAEGALPLVECDLTDPVAVANLELRSGVLPVRMRRYRPDGSSVFVRFKSGSTP